MFSIGTHIPCVRDYTTLLNYGHCQRYRTTGPEGKVRVRASLSFNFLYPSIRVSTAPPLSVRVRVRVRASIGLLYRLYACCRPWPCDPVWPCTLCRDPKSL